MFKKSARSVYIANSVIWTVHGLLRKSNVINMNCDGLDLFIF